MNLKVEMDDITIVIFYSSAYVGNYADTELALLYPLLVQ